MDATVWERRSIISFYTIKKRKDGTKTIIGYIDGFGIEFNNMHIDLEKGIATTSFGTEYILGRTF